MMYAYDQTLLSKARTSLASMFHYAVNIQSMVLTEFYHMFLCSPFSEKFEYGDSATIAGKSGIEIAYLIMTDNNVNIKEHNRIYSLERTPEYWLGGVLAYYQWEKNQKFSNITNAVQIDEILLMYRKYHEIDISHFVIEMDRRIEASFPETMLKRLREYARLSQSALADRAGVPVRTIQQYEQRQKNINNAKAETVIQLARALYCKPEELLEHSNKI